MLANTLTFLRLPLAATFAVLVALQSDATALPVSWAVLLLAVVLCEELTDVFDGIVARRTGTASQLGSIFDPLVDSLSRLTIYFSIALAGWVTIAVPLVMAARDITVAYTRIVQALTGGDTSARISGKFKAFFQAAGVFLIVAFAAAGGSLEPKLLCVLRTTVAGVIIAATCWSLFDYVRGAIAGVRSLRR